MKMKNGFLSLKEDVVLRSDKKRSVIYFRNRHHLEDVTDVIKNATTFSTLSPDLTTALYLMDGTREFKEIEEFVKNFFHMNEEECERFEEHLSIDLDRFYTYESRPKQNVTKHFDLDQILPNLKDIDAFDMSSNYLYYPYTFLLIPSMQCSFDCIYCYADREHAYEPISLEAWESIIYEAALTFKAKDISVSGGDFFLYPNWKEFLKILSYYHYYPELPTKIPLSEKEQIFLYDMGFESYQISLDTLNPLRLGSLLGIKNPEKYARAILNSIESAEKIGLKVSINSVQTRYSYPDLFATMQQLAIYHNIYRIAINTISDSLYKKDMEAILFTEKEKDEYVHQLGMIRKLFNAKNTSLHLNENPYWIGKNLQLSELEYFDRKQCNSARTGIVILPDGVVTACEELYWNPNYILGDLKEQTLEMIFDSPKRWNMIHPMQGDFSTSSYCSSCKPDLFNRCNSEKGRCIRDSLKIFRQEQAPDPRCPFFGKNSSRRSSVSYQPLQSFKKASQRFKSNVIKEV